MFPDNVDEKGAHPVLGSPLCGVKSGLTMSAGETQSVAAAGSGQDSAYKPQPRRPVSWWWLWLIPAVLLGPLVPRTIGFALFALTWSPTVTIYDLQASSPGPFSSVRLQVSTTRATDGDVYQSDELLLVGKPGRRLLLRFPVGILRRPWRNDESQDPSYLRDRQSYRSVSRVVVHPTLPLVAVEMGRLRDGEGPSVWGVVDLRGVGDPWDGAGTDGRAEDDGQRRAQIAADLRYLEIPAELGWAGYLEACPQAEDAAFEVAAGHSGIGFGGLSARSCQALFRGELALAAFVTERSSPGTVADAATAGKLMTLDQALGPEVAAALGPTVAPAGGRMLVVSGDFTRALSTSLVSLDSDVVVVVARGLVTHGSLFAAGPIVFAAHGDVTMSGTATSPSRVAGITLSRKAIYYTGLPQTTLVAPKGGLVDLSRLVPIPDPSAQRAIGDGTHATGAQTGR